MNEIFKDLFYVLIISCAVWIGFYLYTRHDTLEQRVIRYDCRIAEFSPDIPPDVRAECRRQVIERYNQKLMKAD